MQTGTQTSRWILLMGTGEIVALTMLKLLQAGCNVMVFVPDEEAIRSLSRSIPHATPFQQYIILAPSLLDPTQWQPSGYALYVIPKETVAIAYVESQPNENVVDRVVDNVFRVRSHLPAGANVSVWLASDCVPRAAEMHSSLSGHIPLQGRTAEVVATELSQYLIAA